MTQLTLHYKPQMEAHNGVHCSHDTAYTQGQTPKGTHDAVDTIQPMLQRWTPKHDAVDVRQNTPQIQSKKKEHKIL